MTSAPQPLLSMASAAQVLRTALITTPLLLLFVVGVAWIKDLDEIYPERGFRVELTISTISTLPWFVLSPIVVLIAYRQSVLRVGWERITLEILLLVVIIAGIFLAHLAFIEAPYWGRTVDEILTASTIGGQMWDILIFTIAILSGHVQGAVHRSRKSDEPASNAGKIMARSASRVDIVDIADMVAASAQGNYVALITEQREFLHRTTLGEMKKQLADQGFIQVHRSHLVRADSIESVTRADGRIKDVRIRGGRQFPVSAANQNSLSGLLRPDHVTD